VNGLVSGEFADPIAVVANLPRKQGVIAWSTVAVRVELDIHAGARCQGSLLGSNELKHAGLEQVVVVDAQMHGEATSEVILTPSVQLMGSGEPGQRLRSAEAL
jgi:hypothetical protein